MEEQQKPHKRRVRYSGKYPKKFEEKYKELQPEKYQDTIEHVIKKGNTPAGMHISIMVQEILDTLNIQPGETGFDATLGYGGHTKAMLACLNGQGHIYATDVDPEESAKTKKRLEELGYGEDILSIRLQNFCTIDEIAKEVGGFDFILADLGAFTLAGRYAPRCQRHISTQQSVANHVCAQAWYDLGASRVVLAREVSLAEIAAIRQRVSPKLELEAFCHGAMCVSYSGRCLLSNYMTGRDSNRGQCAQPCRYQYALMEEKRPGEYFPVFEDEKGTYIMNSRDMCMIDHLGDLMAAGVDCLKIEGRAKSAYYAAIVTGAYRHCLDAAAAGEPLDPVWRDEVEHISHRHYATGFFYGQPGQYYESARYLRDWQICAVVTDCTPDGVATMSLRNKFAAGDTVELVGPDTKPFTITVPPMRGPDGEVLLEPKTPQMTFTMELPRPVPPMSFVRHAVALSGK